jgi:hypothetical protein
MGGRYAVALPAKAMTYNADNQLQTVNGTNVVR